MRDLHYILLALSVTFSLLPVSEVEAQLIPDNTLGKENSLVNPINSVQRIDGGAIRGSNLFHSFKEFNIGSGKSAYFSNPGNIENILTRVTGKNSSLILGKLGVFGNANLFLINPNGIIFGENAQLDISGSFVGSTADNIKFVDGREFNAINPSANPILTINVPLGLQYRGNGGNIEVRGTATSNLKVPDTKSLALTAANIKFDGGKLTAPAGSIDLFAVTNGEVSLINNNGRINLEAPLGIEYGDIEFLNASDVDTRGNSGGSIQVRGRNITLKGNSRISTNTDGNGFGKTLNITATELVKISESDLLADVQKNATGFGGDLVVNSKDLLVTDGSILSSSTFGLGNGGNLTIETNNLQVDNGGRIDVTTYNLGNGGNLTIKTANLQVYDGAQITAIAFGKGNAGNMEIKANLVELVGFRQSSDTPLKSGLFASALEENGQGGNLNVTANRLVIRDGATINASNFLSFDPDNLQGRAGTGGAGNIDINSPFIRLENQGIITANANAGDKGNINIQSQNLQLRQESVISTNAKNSADGGNINIDTNTLVALENSDIAANSEGSFGGRVIINAEGILGTQFQQQLTPQSDITATSSLGPSFSGVVDINTIAIDPNSGLIELPQTLTDSSQKIKAVCAASAGNNFVVSPRGGLPQSPDDLFNGSTTYTQLNDVIPTQDITSDINDRNYQTYGNNLLSVDNKQKYKNQNQNQNQIVEATGWVVDANGDVVLVAKIPQHSQQSPTINSPSCKDFSS